MESDREICEIARILKIYGVESDREICEKARMLKEYIENIRAAYTRDFTSEDDVKQQKAVATYLIDKLAFSAGPEKDSDVYVTCAIKVGNVRAIPPSSLEFNFQRKGMTSKITVKVELFVYQAILQFQTGKNGDDHLLDKLDTTKLNTHLNELMPGLTTEVFYIYNTSATLENILNKETIEEDVFDKSKVFSHALDKVSVIMHNNASHCTTAERVKRQNAKLLYKLQGILADMKEDLARAKEGKPLKVGAEEEKEYSELARRDIEDIYKVGSSSSPSNIKTEFWIKRKITLTTLKIRRMERSMKPSAFPLRFLVRWYLDPRIAVAWCRRNRVSVEKVISKPRLENCAWAMGVEPDFRY